MSKVLTKRPLEIFVQEDPELHDMDVQNRFTKFILKLVSVQKYCFRRYLSIKNAKMGIIPVIIFKKLRKNILFEKRSILQIVFVN